MGIKPERSSGRLTVTPCTRSAQRVNLCILYFCSRQIASSFPVCHSHHIIHPCHSHWKQTLCYCKRVLLYQSVLQNCLQIQSNACELNISRPLMTKEHICTVALHVIWSRGKLIYIQMQAGPHTFGLGISGYQITRLWKPVSHGLCEINLSTNSMIAAFRIHS